MYKNLTIEELLDRIAKSSRVKATKQGKQYTVNVTSPGIKLWGVIDYLRSLKNVRVVVD